MVLGDVTVLSSDLVGSRLGNLGRTPQGGHAFLNADLSNLGLSDISALQVGARSPFVLLRLIERRVACSLWSLLSPVPCTPCCLFYIDSNFDSFPF